MRVLRDLTKPDHVFYPKPFYISTKEKPTARPTPPHRRGGGSSVSPEQNQRQTAGGVVHPKASPPEPKWFEGHVSRSGSIPKRSSSRKTSTAGLSAKGSRVYQPGRSYSCGQGSFGGGRNLSSFLGK